MSFVIANVFNTATQAADALIGIRGDIHFMNNTVEIFDGTIFLQDFVQIQMFQGSSMNFTNNRGV